MFLQLNISTRDYLHMHSHLRFSTMVQSKSSPFSRLGSASMLDGAYTRVASRAKGFRLRINSADCLEERIRDLRSTKYNANEYMKDHICELWRRQTKT